jgi:hypothetical protein
MILFYKLFSLFAFQFIYSFCPSFSRAPFRNPFFHSFITPITSPDFKNFLSRKNLPKGATLPSQIAEINNQINSTTPADVVGGVGGTADLPKGPPVSVPQEVVSLTSVGSKTRSSESWGSIVIYLTHSQFSLSTLHHYHLPLHAHQTESLFTLPFSSNTHTNYNYYGNGVAVGL